MLLQSVPIQGVIRQDWTTSRYKSLYTHGITAIRGLSSVACIYGTCGSLRVRNRDKTSWLLTIPLSVFFHSSFSFFPHRTPSALDLTKPIHLCFCLFVGLFFEGGWWERETFQGGNASFNRDDSNFLKRRKPMKWVFKIFWKSLCHCAILCLYPIFYSEFDCPRLVHCLNISLTKFTLCISSCTIPWIVYNYHM